MVARNPKYDGLYVFKPDLAKLRSGDIILTRNAETQSRKSKFKSTTIALITGGNFSHALLCTTPPTMIEAIGDGVSNISAQICFAHDLNNVRVLRYIDEQIARTAGSLALRFLGQEYSVRRAIRSLVPDISGPEPESDQTFCSALVAAAFRAAGAPEYAAINPMKVTPASLEHAKHFKDVTGDIFIRILSPSNIEEMSAFDGDRILSPLAGQAKLFNSYYNKLLPLFNEFISQNQNLTITRTPTSFLDCLGFILGAYSACKKLPPGQEAAATCNHLRSLDKAAHDLLAAGELREMLKKADRLEEESHRYTISESFKPDPDIDENDTVGLIQVTKQQISDRSSIFKGETMMGVSLAWDEWCAIMKEVIDVLIQRLAVLEEILERVFPQRAKSLPGTHD